MAKKGRPKKYTEEKFLEKFNEYMAECNVNEKLANISGFCVFADISRDTFYEYGNYFPYTFKKIEAILEDHTLNAKMNDTFRIFYLKNKFGYRDRQEIDQNNTNYEAQSYEEFIKATKGDEY